MSMRPAAPGAQIGAGRLRVDAARAIAKLREYQLVDRHAWILEAIRAAVASAATRIDLDGDSNDVWLSWQGPAWEPELLPRLFDELVSPEPEEKLHHARLLAAAVNSALGMNPAYVDVYACPAGAPARRVRYTPDVLAEPASELGEAKLRHVAIETAEPPVPVSGGMLLHLRRRISLEVVKNLVGGPRELAIASAACRDLEVPLHVGRDVLHRDRNKDLVRVPLGEGLAGYAAIGRPVVLQEGFEVAERGVVLARYPLEVLTFQPTSALPVRVFLDAPRLPTNASRSQVRQDVHPISTAAKRASKAVEEAIGKLATLVTEGSEPAREAALALLAAEIAGPPPGWGAPSERLHALATLPLLKNAYGQPRPVLTSWRRFIHTGDQPLDADLEEWLGEVVWLRPEDPARTLLGSMPLDPRAMRRALRDARRQRRARKKFLAHATRELRIETSETPRVRAQVGAHVPDSCVPDAELAELRGEVCIYGAGRDSALVVTLDARELERIEMKSAIPFDAIIDSKRVSPGPSYRGVARDREFSLVLWAMRASVVRAIEGLVALRALPGIELGGEANLASDMELVRHALVLAKSLELELRGPLARAPAWTSVTGARVRLSELRMQRVIGFVAPGTQLTPPAGRIVLVLTQAEVAELRELVKVPLVPYGRVAGVSARITPKELASGLTRFQGAACLAITDGDLIATIGLASQTNVQLFHMARPLGAPYPRTSELGLRCAIAVDSEALVPNTVWSAPFDEVGLTRRSYREWELALVRAIASTIVGDRPAALLQPDSITFEDDNGRALADVVRVHGPELLGDDLRKRLCAMPLFRLLGRVAPVSVDEIAALYPDQIPYLESAHEEAGSFAPLVASDTIAQMVAVLAGPKLVSGLPELRLRAQRALFESRYTAHLSRKIEPLALPRAWSASPDTTVELSTKLLTGVVGVGTERCMVHVFVASRPFMVIHLTMPYALRVAVEIPTELISETFDDVKAWGKLEITQTVLDAVPALIERVARELPHELGGASAARTLLATYLTQTATLPTGLWTTLRAAPAFATIQGGRVSLDEAATPRSYISTASYEQPWVPRVEGEPDSALDAPILFLPAERGELHTIIKKLHGDSMGDVTLEVTRLQGRRRMAQGLVPTPKVGAGIEAAFKRELRTFGALTAKLGPGEVGLIAASQGSRPAFESTVLIHEQGQLQQRVPIDVRPGIELAVETPSDHYSIDELRGVAQQIAVELTNEVLEARPVLSSGLRRSLARALLARRIPPVLAREQPVFVRPDGTWIDFATFEAQLERFGEVWAVTGEAPGEPLDPERVVIVLDSLDIDLAVQNGFAVKNAKLELELDAKARQNQTRPRATSLEILRNDGMLAQAELDGDGKRGPRGALAILDPGAAKQRGTYVYRDMFPLGRIDDVCNWPTVANVDDARIVPDRTWSGPKLDETWQAIAKQLRTESERLLATLGEVPGDALTSLRINNHACAGVKELRSAPRTLIRGLLWLTGVPYAPTAIRVRHRGGTRSFVPGRGLPIGGSLFIHDPDDIDLERALEQLCDEIHGKLVRQAIKLEDADRDLVTANVAHALAIATLAHTEVGKALEFPCFLPRPLDARQLANLFRRTDPVPTFPRRISYDSHELAFVQDGSMAADIIRVHLGQRVVKGTPPKKKRVEEPRPVEPVPMPDLPVSTQRPAAPAPTPAALKPPPPPHALEPLVEALDKRLRQLGIRSFTWGIDDTASVPVALAGGQILLSGTSPRLRRVAAELKAKGVIAEPALDAVAAHVVTILNVELTEITDGSELHALGVLLSPRSAGQRRSRRSS